MTKLVAGTVSTVLPWPGSKFFPKGDLGGTSQGPPHATLRAAWIYFSICVQGITAPGILCASFRKGKLGNAYSSRCGHLSRASVFRAHS